MSEIIGQQIDYTAPAAETTGYGVVPNVLESPAPVQADAASADALRTQANAAVGAPVSADAPQGEPEPTENTQGADDGGDGYDLGEITNPAVLGVANMFKNAGIKADDAMQLFAKAVESGSADDIDTDGIKKALGDTIGAMVVQVMRGVIAENQQQAQAIQERFIATVGGEDAWNAIKTWVNAEESKDPTFKATIDSYRELANRDEASAMLVANALKSMYKDANITRKPSAFVQGDPRAAAIGIAPITDMKDFGRMYYKAMESGDTSAMENTLARWRAGGGRGGK